jgi:hypothetical protein
MGGPRGLVRQRVHWLASMTHLSVNPRAFVYRAVTLCLIPNHKGVSGAILGRLSSAINFFSDV